jgi:ribosome-dependent ATPase
MNEDMRCDRISLMHAGRVLAADAPEKLIEARGAANLEDAFIRYMEDAIAEGKTPKAAAAPPAPRKDRFASLPVRRMLAYARNEAIQIRRDPVRLAFAFVGSALLMLVFGFGITTDVEHIRFAAFDRDQSPESRFYVEQFRASPQYFTVTSPVWSDAEGLARLQSDDISLIVELPPDFGRDQRRGTPPEVLAHVDGAMPFRGETVSGYVRGVNNVFLSDAIRVLGEPTAAPRAQIQSRYLYNPTFESIYAIVPSVPALLLILIPAILMTVSIVREKELGSIINFYVTPTGRLEYLLGKQLPYLAIGMINFFILAAIASIVFGVPIKGSFLLLTLCTLLYLIATTGVGMVTSTFTKTQVAAVFITAILTIQPTIQFAGLLQPVSTLEGSARFIGSIWPTTYYMHSSIGAYTKGLRAGLMVKDLIVLLCSIPVLLTLSTLGLRKQDK